MSELPLGIVPGALVLPLRDAARGVGSFAARSRRLLRPSTRHLPDPLRDFAHHVIDRARLVSEQTAFRRHPVASDIVAAREVLAGTLSPTRGARGLAAVIGYALDKGLAAEGQNAPLVSETVLALAAGDALRATHEETDPPMRGALLVSRLVEAPVAGAMPGIPLGFGGADRERMQRVLVAAVLWLLADRSELATDEDELLALCLSLTEAAFGEIAPTLGDPEALAAELHRLADVI